MTEPRLIATHLPRHPQAVVLVLHGGGARRASMMVSPAQLSVLRMVPVARRIARAGRRDLAVLRLLNSQRGWDTQHTPVDDVAWALAQVAERLGELPVGLVGHSLGGRAALLAASYGPVRSAVALNPYVLPQDRPDLAGRRTLIVQGDEDRIASPSRSADLMRRLPATSDVGYVSIEGGRHAMLRHGRTFEELAAQFTAAVLTGRHDVRSETVRTVLGGQRWVTR